MHQNVVIFAPKVGFNIFHIFLNLENKKKKCTEMWSFLHQKLVLTFFIFFEFRKQEKKCTEMWSFLHQKLVLTFFIFFEFRKQEKKMHRNVVIFAPKVGFDIFHIF